MGIVKKLTRIGNSYGVILPREVLRVVGIDPRKGYQLSLEKDRLSIEPAEKAKNRDEEVTEAMLRFMKKYRSDLKKLAST